VDESSDKNPLRKVYMTKVENQTINNITPVQIPTIQEPVIEVVKEEIDLDF